MPLLTDLSYCVYRYSKTARYRMNPAAGNPNSDSGTTSNNNNYPSASISRNNNFGAVNNGYSSNNYNNNNNNMNSAMGYNNSNSNAKANTIAALNPTMGGMSSLNPTAALNMPAASSRFGRLAQFGVMGSSSSGTAQTVSGAIPGYSSANSANVGPSAGFGRHKF